VGDGIPDNSKYDCWQIKTETVMIMTMLDDVDSGGSRSSCWGGGEGWKRSGAVHPAGVQGAESPLRV